VLNSFHSYERTFLTQSLGDPLLTDLRPFVPPLPRFPPPSLGIFRLPCGAGIVFFSLAFLSAVHGLFPEGVVGSSSSRTDSIAHFSLRLRDHEFRGAEVLVSDAAVLQDSFFFRSQFPSSFPPLLTPFLVLNAVPLLRQMVAEFHDRMITSFPFRHGSPHVSSPTLSSDRRFVPLFPATSRSCFILTTDSAILCFLTLHCGYGPFTLCPQLLGIGLTCLTHGKRPLLFASCACRWIMVFPTPPGPFFPSGSGSTFSKQQARWSLMDASKTTHLSSPSPSSFLTTFPR